MGDSAHINLYKAPNLIRLQTRYERYKQVTKSIMPVSVKLPSEFQYIYQNLLKKEPEEGTIQLVINELRRRLAEYKLMDKTFHERYKMDFDELKMKQVVKKAGYSFKVEEDYCDWELALDGIKTITKELKKLAKYS